jgi:hypothetical protein
VHTQTPRDSGSLFAGDRVSRGRILVYGMPFGRGTCCRSR